jgi:hypothetical protein
MAQGPMTALGPDMPGQEHDQQLPGSAHCPAACAPAAAALPRRIPHQLPGPVPGRRAAAPDPQTLQRVLDGLRRL